MAGKLSKKAGKKGAACRFDRQLDSKSAGKPEAARVGAQR